MRERTMSSDEYYGDMLGEAIREYLEAVRVGSEYGRIAAAEQLAHAFRMGISHLTDEDDG